MDQLIAQLGLALAIGLLVGLERGWRERDAPDRSRTAGLRTFGLVGLLGGIFAALSEALGSGVLIAGFLGFAAIFAWFSAREAEHDQNFSVTGVVAGLIVFALGALAVVGDTRTAAAGGAALAAVLAPALPCEDFYFVASGDGGHVFSRTKEEHDRARAALRRAMRDAASG